MLILVTAAVLTLAVAAPYHDRMRLPASRVILIVFGGVAAAAIAAKLEPFFTRMLGRDFLMWCMGTGLREEFAKGLIFLLICFAYRRDESTFATVITGAGVSGTFATLETLAVMIDVKQAYLANVLLRTTVSLPVHIMLGLVPAAAFARSRGAFRALVVAAALTSAAAIHGLVDYSIPSLAGWGKVGLLTADACLAGLLLVLNPRRSSAAPTEAISRSARLAARMGLAWMTGCIAFAASEFFGLTALSGKGVAESVALFCFCACPLKNLVSASWVRRRMA